MKFKDNDEVRDYIVSEVFINGNMSDLALEKFYKKLKKDNSLCERVLRVIYSSSYVYNYVAFEMYPEDEELQDYMDFLNSIKSYTDMISKIDFNMFKNMCSDTVDFQLMEPYLKKEYMSRSLFQEKKILKVDTYFAADALSILKKYNISCVMDYYKKMFEDSKDKNEAFNDTVNYITDLLIKLEEDDYDNYQELLRHIIDVYYKYVKYNSNLKINEEQSDLLSMIENDISRLICYCTNNEDIIKELLHGFISYKLLPSTDRMKIEKNINNKNKYEVITPINIIRQLFNNNFGNLLSLKEEHVEYYTEELNDLKNSSNFDNYVSLLYIDNLTISYLSMDEDDGEEFTFMKSFLSLDEYKQYLLSDDYILLLAIKNSISFNELSFIDKKIVITSMMNEGIYKDSISNLYLLDIIENCRRFDLSDAFKIYDDIYNKIGDDNYAKVESSEYLCYILYKLKKYDRNNYDYIINEICKIVYEYFLYLYGKNQEIDYEYYIIVDEMKKNLDAFYDEVTNSTLLIKLLSYFYEYYSLKQVDKFIVDSNYKLKSNDKNVLKFNKKNKNSN